MTGAYDTRRCENCGVEHPAVDLDPGGWCAECRAIVVRRATLIARLLAILGSLLVGLWVATVIEPGSRFALGWVLIVVAVYYLLYKLARRVSFEVIRSRGVRPRAKR